MSQVLLFLGHIATKTCEEVAMVLKECNKNGSKWLKVAALDDETPTTIKEEVLKIRKLLTQTSEISTSLEARYDSQHADETGRSEA